MYQILYLKILIFRRSELVFEDISLDLSVERTHAQKLTCNLIYDLLKILQNNQDFYDKHTTKYMNEVIEKKMDSEKEENLKFIEELDKESRQSLKSMITIGFDSWKNLSKKDDKDLYFGENVQENVIAEDNSFEINYNDEELNTLIEKVHYKNWRKLHRRTIFRIFRT